MIRSSIVPCRLVTLRAMAQARSDDFIDGVGLKLIAAVVELLHRLRQVADQLGHRRAMVGQRLGMAGLFPFFESLGAALLRAFGMAGFARLFFQLIAFGFGVGNDLVGIAAGAEGPIWRRPRCHASKRPTR